MRRMMIVLAAMAAMVVYAGAALATSVSEVEPNDSIGQAQNIDPYFSLDSDPNITNSTTVPHATVNGTGNNTYDYYSFTVPQAGVSTISLFDIDAGMPSFDSYLRLYNGNGLLLAQNDDAFPTDPGSTHSFDSYLQYNFPSAGIYYIKVSRYVDIPIPGGASYRLNVSVPNHALNDTTPPQLNLPADITQVATGPDGAEVSWQDPTATDENPANPQVSCSRNSGETFAIGTTTVNCSATDAAGNTANGSFDVTVNYAFAGFFSPVDNPNVLNKAKAGSAIPVKFSLGGNMGLDVLATGSPSSQTIGCDSSNPVDALEETVTAGSSSLSYDATTDQYTYVWKTNKAWATTCRQLEVKLDDDSTHLANFTFVK